MVNCLRTHRALTPFPVSLSSSISRPRAQSRPALTPGSFFQYQQATCTSRAAPPLSFLVKNGPRWGPVGLGVGSSDDSTVMDGTRGGFQKRWIEVQLVYRSYPPSSLCSVRLPQFLCFVRAGNRSNSRPNRPVHSPALRVQELYVWKLRWLHVLGSPS